MNRRWASRLVWLATGAMVALLACEPEEGTVPLYWEDFETVCDGAPCGWARTMGTPEQATWVETIHPGEHGLRLTGDVSVRGPEAPENYLRLRGNAVLVQVASICDDGNDLDVTVVVEDDRGVLYDRTVNVPALPWWSSRGLNVAFEVETILGGRVVAVILDKSGPGTCEVADITVDFSAYCSEGCC